MRLTFIVLLSMLVCSCKEQIEDKKAENRTNGYEEVIENYLGGKILQPTFIYDVGALHVNSEGSTDLLDHHIEWRPLNNGIQITVNEDSFSTGDKITQNFVSGPMVDSVNFANSVGAIKFYQEYSLIGFSLNYSPCTGIGCSVAYQIIYDLETQQQSYFGTFRSNGQFELYDFNHDKIPDFLSKSYYGGNNPEGIDTILYECYSQTAQRTFKKHKEYWFRHIYKEKPGDPESDQFDESWIERITIESGSTN